MQSDTGLKEARRHSDEAMPIKSYRYTAPAGRVPVHCHWHDEMEFFTLISGTARIQRGARFFDAAPGDLMFFNSGELHSAEPDGTHAVSLNSIVFHPDLLGESGVVRAKYIAPLIGGRLAPPLKTEGIESFQALFSLLENKPAGYEIEARALLLHLFYLLVRASERWVASPASSIQPAMELMAKNYARAVSEEELAGVCGMSTGHFCRVFRRQTLKTPMEYLKGVRISKAMELLLSGDMKIIDVAMETGFNSPSYFIGVFREVTGTTPKKFRSRQAKG